MQISFRPIDHWPRDFTKNRRRSPFKASYHSTMRLLERELGHANARDALVQLALPPSQFRLDGLPYADAKPQHPGVIVSFTKGKAPLAFPCDSYLTWVENLRAIALALDALRRVDRYGVTKHAEQYRGWSALPPAIITPAAMDPREAADYVREISKKQGGQWQNLMSDLEAFQSAYRTAAKVFHPDANGGTEHPEWHRLQQAKDVLEKHHAARTGH